MQHTLPGSSRSLETLGEDHRRRLAFGRLCILGAAVLWSLGGVITKGLEGLDGATIAFYRGLFAGLALLPFVPRSRMTFQKGMIPLVFAFAGMSGLFIGAIKATTSANAIFLQYSAVIWAIPASLIILREKPRARTVLGASGAAVGIAVILLLGKEHAQELPNNRLGIGMGLGSGACYALVVTFTRALRKCHPIWLSVVNNLGAAIILGGWIMATSGSIPIPSPAQAAVLLILGVVQMAIPLALFSRGLQDVSAPEAGVISLAEPLLNPLLVFAFIGEAPAPETRVGGLFLLAGMALRYMPAWQFKAREQLSGEVAPPTPGHGRPLARLRRSGAASSWAARS